jgi:small conductance mechanosensitive channel
MKIISSFFSVLMTDSTSLPIILMQKTLTVVVIFLVFYGLSVLFYHAGMIFLKRHQPKKYHLFQLVSTFIKTLIILIGAMTALGTVGVNISAIVASLGLTGFAVGFACKDFLTNVLSGFMVILYGAYEINDWVKVLNIEGRVEDINLRYTVIDAGERLCLIPNALVFSHPVMIGKKDWGKKESI